MPTTNSAKKPKGMNKKIASALREAAARRAKARAQGARPRRRSVRRHAAIGRRRSEQLLVPHGRSGHRRDGAREGVPVREPGRPVPLAHRRGASPPLPRARTTSASATSAATRSRSSDSTHYRTRATASTASSARKMQRSNSGALLARAGAGRDGRLLHEGARRQAGWLRSTCRTTCSATGCGSRSCTIPGAAFGLHVGAVLALDLHGADDRRARDPRPSLHVRRVAATRCARSRSRSSAAARSAT